MSFKETFAVSMHLMSGQTFSGLISISDCDIPDINKLHWRNTSNVRRNFPSSSTQKTLMNYSVAFSVSKINWNFMHEMNLLNDSIRQSSDVKTFLAYFPHGILLQNIAVKYECFRCCYSIRTEQNVHVLSICTIYSLIV